MTAPLRVVFDCNIFLQAIASPDGPAGRCVQLAIDGLVDLFLSPTVLVELRDVASRSGV
jgi:predicted nucleic acid-binding protein